MDLALLQTALELGLICSLTVLALFLSYTMLNVCDLSTDGCFTLGAAVGAVVALSGHPFLALPAAMAAGMCSGFVTALLQTRMGINSLLAGIIVNTGLYSINIWVMGGKSLLNLNKTDTVFVRAREILEGTPLAGSASLVTAALAAHLENQGVRCSVIYGSLPPATRREQVRRFLERETEVVVSTDAIGMGLNLPIRRIVFVETRKFDGTARRSLLPEEIRQIAGRAGRFGLYDEGFVTAIDDIETIEDGLSARPLPIMKAYVGFPEQLLNLPAEIDTLVKIWAGMEAPAIYEKMEVDELLSLYMSFERIHGDHLEEFTKQEIYKLITCSVDIDNRLVMDLWKDYCREYREVDELEFPYSPGTDLYDMESYYKMLDLYFQFSRKTGLPVQEENLFHERRSTEEEISRILRTECGSYTRKCSICGRELSWDHPFSICERCFERGRSSQKRSRFHDQRYNH